MGRRSDVNSVSVSVDDNGEEGCSGDSEAKRNVGDDRNARPRVATLI